MNAVMPAYVIRRSTRARRVSVTVLPEGKVVVTLPVRAAERRAHLFVAENAAWIAKQIEAYGRQGDRVPLYGGRSDYLRFKERARARVHSLVREINASYGFAYRRIAIKDTHGGWGSCSSLGNLNFNYRLVHLPDRLAAYVVAHELCHLAELNHSPRFWALVARTVPDHKARRRELDRYLI